MDANLICMDLEQDLKIVSKINNILRGDNKISFEMFQISKLQRTPVRQI